MTIISKHITPFLLLFFLLLFNMVESQETDYILGRLINVKDKTPIPFASIIIKNKSKGVISNNDGGFQIPYELQKIGDTLLISSIGYSSMEVALANLSRDEMNIINLSEKMEVLDEVVLIASKKYQRKSAKEIVRLALDKIPKNYPFRPFSYIGYYRDYQIKDGTYLNLNEALMEVFDPGFGVLDANETDVRIYRYNKNLDFQTDTVAARPYDYRNGSKTMSDVTLNRNGSNEYSILRIHDVIRNHDQNTFDFINRMKTDIIKNHDLRLLPDTFINDVPLYAIKLHKVYGDIRAVGTIFISKEDYKIYKIQYAGYNKRKRPQSQKKTPPNVDLPNSQDNNREKLLIDIKIEYQPREGVMFPSYISFNNAFEVLQPADFRLVNTKVNHKRGCIELTFNQKPAYRNSIKKSRYRLWENDMKLNIDSVAIENNKVLLFLKNDGLVNDPNKLELPGTYVDKQIRINVRKITDEHGNILSRRKLTSYNQYREFFVQEINTKPDRPMDKLYMLKNQPIFQDQPIAPFSNLSDYWMNTPLQSQ